MAQLADAIGSKPIVLRDVWVRVPLRAHHCRHPFAQYPCASIGPTRDVRPCWGTVGRTYHAGVSSYGLKILDREECDALLRTHRVGRVGVCTYRPLVLPVVYALLDADVVFRTAPGEKLIAATLQRPVAFEIDEYDVSARTGWSVLVVGAAEEIVVPEELKRVRALDLQPWAGEFRDRFVRIRAEEVSGRRVDPDA